MTGDGGGNRPDGAGPLVPRMRASDADRNEVLDVLAEAHAHGRLAPDEVDERQGTVLAARYLDELPAVLVDLPEGREVVAALYAELAGFGEAGGGIQRYDDGSGASGSGGGAGRGVAPRRSTPPAVRPSAPVPAVPGTGEPEFALVVFSGKHVVPEAGTPGERSIALMGGTETDLRDVMGPGVEFTADLYAMWGGHEIRVPRGVRIVDRTFNVMGGVSMDEGVRGDGSMGTLVLHGFHLMGGTTVTLVGGDDDGLDR
ncbi:DUF1707 domain-containing protein [Brevibacterium samyangense]|uniref:DUF1707 domain-containing protein n=1 Tax=Brevibacterium samyangense TaxID=366888 RepID=A0ABN2TJC6_9MICO